MDPIEKKSLEFLIELARVIRNMQMYNENHPIVKQGALKVQRMLDQVLASLPSLTFGASQNHLLIQSKQITEKNAIADRFVQMLQERNINGVKMHKGTNAQELLAFVKLMSTKPDHVVKDGRVIPELLKPFKKIKINEIEFVMLDEGEDLESLTEARKFFNTIFTEEFKDLKGADALKQIGAVIQKILPKMADQGFDDGDKELWGFFERSIESFGGGNLTETRQSLLTTVRTMDPKVQKSLFGQVITNSKELESVLKQFSNESKVSILSEEVESGRNLSQALDSLLKSKGDVVELAEELSKKFSGEDTESQEKLNKIFNLLQRLDSSQVDLPSRGKVLIADSDEECRKIYDDLFRRMNFETSSIDNGKDLFNTLQKSPALPEILIMDAKLPGRSGLEILSDLDMSKMRVPVILSTEMVSVENSFEVQMYSKLKFIKKPFEISAIMDAANELCPPPPPPEPPKKKEPDSPMAKVTETAAGTEITEEIAAELTKAREIQRNLMPSTFPNMPGYEVYSYYKACDMVGGDYYDVIPIDDENVGLLIADVSGHGVTGAMIMVMVRSAIRAWAHTTISPKELLSSVNPMVARDILSGFFCTVYYAVLNMPNRTLTCSCAGHNPAIIWNANTKECTFTKKGGMPLGILSGPSFDRTLQEEVIQLNQGDRLVLYTDGLVETMDMDDEEYGEDRFCKTIQKAATQKSDICVKYLINGVLKFQGKRPQFDDLTLITLRALK